VNEEQREGDEVNHWRWMAGEMTGDEKQEPKRSGDQWRVHGSVYVSPVAGGP
jgi:hypothetical protein